MVRGTNDIATLFGLQINPIKKTEQAPSIAPPVKDDGAIVINTPGSSSGTAAGIYLDLEGAVKNEAELITKYRDMSLHPEIDQAIDEIVNEAIVSEEGEKTVEINLDEVPISEGIKKKIEAEFDNVLQLLDFNWQSYEVFRQWYIDGRLYYLILVDKKNLTDGIQELRVLDPRKIRKVRQVKNQKDESGINTIKIVSEYYIYSDKALMAGPTSQMTSITTTAAGIKIAKDSVIYATSGVTNTNKTMVLSHLHWAIKYLNMLRSMEDSLVIYRIVRAPERRVFYIDIGNMPHIKAEQYVKDIMTKHKNKVTYDAETGVIQDARRFLTMTEDFYVPRREGGKGTQIETLPGGQSLNQIDDVKYFQNKLYTSLKVPVSRLNPEYMFDIGRSTQISRDETKFAKFIDRLRLRFATCLFNEALKTNLIFKGVMSPEDWDEISYYIRYKWNSDNDWAELKDLEILTGRLQALAMAEPYIGRFISNKQARVKILRQTEDDIEQNDEEIAEEMDDPQFQPFQPIGPDLEMGPMAGGPQPGVPSQPGGQAQKPAQQTKPAGKPQAPKGPKTQQRNEGSYKKHAQPGKKSK